MSKQCTTDPVASYGRPTPACPRCWTKMAMSCHETNVYTFECKTCSCIVQRLTQSDTQTARHLMVIHNTAPSREAGQCTFCGGKRRIVERERITSSYEVRTYNCSACKSDLRLAERINRTTEIKCPSCNGTGFSRVARVPRPGRKIYAAACSACRGKGRIPRDIRRRTAKPGIDAKTNSTDRERRDWSPRHRRPNRMRLGREHAPYPRRRWLDPGPSWAFSRTGYPEFRLLSGHRETRPVWRPSEAPIWLFRPFPNGSAAVYGEVGETWDCSMTSGSARTTRRRLSATSEASSTLTATPNQVATCPPTREPIFLTSAAAILSSDFRCAIPEKTSRCSSVWPAATSPKMWSVSALRA